MPLFYGKLHALTVVAILTEPRVAKAEWFRSQESDGPSITAAAGPGGPRRAVAGAAARRDSGSGPVETPYMDYTRPSQYDLSRSDGETMSTSEEVKTPTLGLDVGDSPSRQHSVPAHAHAQGARRRIQRPRQPQPISVYAPVNPTCAHCHMPWLPSDLDTPVSMAYLDSPTSTSEKGEYGVSGKEQGGGRGYFDVRGGHARQQQQQQYQMQQAAVGLGRPVRAGPGGAQGRARGGGEGEGEVGEVAAVPVLNRDGGIRPRQFSLAEMLSDDSSNPNGGPGR